MTILKIKRQLLLAIFTINISIIANITLGQNTQAINNINNCPCFTAIEVYQFLLKYRENNTKGQVECIANDRYTKLGTTRCYKVGEYIQCTGVGAFETHQDSCRNFLKEDPSRFMFNSSINSQIHSNLVNRIF